ncbi:hypothetical protein [Flagellimonas oceanensis]|uniref:hypothetical protein n=1 Tax=Flagellimonas oceanensis TaxID=2499163 RepID=UPI003BACE404
MKTHLLSALIVILFQTSCSGQSKRIEEKMMECTYQSYPDNGLAFKQLISDYQTLLIDEEILADSSAKSYRDLLKKFADGKGFDKVPSKYFYIEFRNLEKGNEEALRKCREQVLNDSAMYSSSKLKAFKSVIQSNSPKASILAKEILDVLSEEDFELHLYKLCTFMMFSYIETDAGVVENAQTVTDYDRTKALNIRLTKNKEILVNNQSASMAELKTLVKEYEYNNESKSTIILISHADLSYGFYKQISDAIIQEIAELRNRISIEKFNLEYKALNEEQKSQINEIYPHKFVEKMQE